MVKQAFNNLIHLKIIVTTATVGVFVIFVFLGLSDFTISTQTAYAHDNDVWYSVDGADWTRSTANAQWGIREGHGFIVFNRSMWVIGGFVGSFASANDVWYSTDGTDWTQATAGSQWIARANHGSLAFNNRMWIVGGFVSGFNTANDVWSSTDGVDWTTATAAAQWGGRAGFSSLVFANSMWLIGGQSSNDVWRSADGIDWTSATAGAQWSARGSHTSLIYNSEMWLLGGGLPSNDVWRSADGEDWTRVTVEAAWGARSEFSATVYSNRIWIFGGNVASGECILGSTVCNDVWSSSLNAGLFYVNARPNIGLTDGTGSTDDPYGIDGSANVPVSDTPDPIEVGATITFTANWWDDNVPWPSPSQGYGINEPAPSQEGANYVGQNWTRQATSGQFSAREKLASLIFNNRMYLIGGNDFTPQLHTGPTTSFRAGDDASNDGTAKSYTDAGCGAGTVLDNHTGLCWQYDDQSNRTWNSAIDYCDTLTLAASSDWRIPTMYEGLTMLDYECTTAGGSCYGDFQNTIFDWGNAGDSGDFWLSTTPPDATSFAYALDTNWGYVFANLKSGSIFVRCVR